MELEFVKGHMGGNRIILLDGTQIPHGQELQTGLHALDELTLSGHQVGLLYPPERGGDVRARIISVCGRDFIPACGGFTQVLGHALATTELSDRFNLDLTAAVNTVTIEFDYIDVNITIHNNDKGVEYIETDFTSFAEEVDHRGIATVDLDGIRSTKVGHFFVLNAEDVKAAHPNASCDIMDDTTKELLTLLQWRFLGVTGLTSWDFGLYDWAPQNGGTIRVLFPHNIRIGFLEPTCGTGSIALGLALLHSGEAAKNGLDGKQEVVFDRESGGDLTIGGPDITRVRFEMADNTVKKTFFTNNRVEIVAKGSIIL